MPKRSRPPNRRSIRLRGYDYAGPESLFFTICSAERCDYFGAVSVGEMNLKSVGELAWSEWRRTIELRQEMIPHAFIVMSNHVHGLISMVPSPVFVAKESTPPLDLPLHARKRPHSLSTIATGFKGAVTRVMRKRSADPFLEIWQRNYYEHVVRNEQEFQTIYRDIQENPKRWNEDRFNPLNGG